MRLAIVTLLVAIALPLAAQTPLIDQGRALMEKNDYGHAAEVLEKAVAATPKSAEAHYLLGSVLVIVFRHQRASLIDQRRLRGQRQCDGDE